MAEHKRNPIFGGTLLMPSIFLFCAAISWFILLTHTGKISLAMPYTVFTVSMALCILICLIVYLTATYQAQNNQLETERASSQRLAAVLEATSDFVATFNQQGVVLYINNAGQRMLGYSHMPAQELHIDHFFEVAAWNLIARTGLPTALKQGLWKTETTIRHANGHLLSVLLMVMSHSNESGNETVYSVLAHDMSEEKKREETLKAKDDLLEQSKDDFLSIAAHQLRTPLGSMKWKLEMMLHGDYGKFSPQGREGVMQLWKSNQRMIALVNNLLDVSSIEQNRAKNKPTVIHVGEVIKKITDELAEEAKGKNISLALSIDPDLSPLLIDYDRLYAVLENIIANAIKYSGEKGSVSIRATQTSGAVVCTISDKGIGVLPADTERIFQKFFRAPQAIRSETDGSGLGLFIAKSYAEAWGGSLTYAPNAKKGSVFTVTIPLRPLAVSSSEEKTTHLAL